MDGVKEAYVGVEGMVAHGKHELFNIQHDSSCPTPQVPASPSWNTKGGARKEMLNFPLGEIALKRKSDETNLDGEVYFVL